MSGKIGEGLRRLFLGIALETERAQAVSVTFRGKLDHLHAIARGCGGKEVTAL